MVNKYKINRPLSCIKCDEKVFRNCAVESGYECRQRVPSKAIKPLTLEDADK